MKHQQLGLVTVGMMKEAMTDINPGVSLADIRRIAELANLGLTSEEEMRMQCDLRRILEYMLRS